MIAYAVYKKQKDDLAIQFKMQYGAAEVPQKLQEWHDLVAHNSTQLEAYLTTAKTFVAVMKNEIETEVRQEVANEHSAAVGVLTAQHQQEIADLRGKVTDAEKKARDEWSDKMAKWAVQTTNPGRFKKVFLATAKWLGITIAGAFSTALVTGFMVFVLALFNTEISATANSVAKGIIDKLLPPDDPSGLGFDSFTNKNQAAKPAVSTPP